MVSAIDWSSVTNKIVSCSHDRNAFVWTFQPDTNTWKPALVILRIDRAATDVRWSADGLRFAVTSGAKCVPVCTYESANDWYEIFVSFTFMDEKEVFTNFYFC
jgi:actin related protein 2/3 complex subunit 1A/1B